MLYIKIQGGHKMSKYKIHISISIFILILIVANAHINKIENKKINDCVKKIVEVEATVIDKRHTSASITIIGKNIISHPPEYSIIITDGDIEKEVNNKELYNNLEIGDKIIVNKVILTKKNGEVYRKELKLIENQ